MMQNAGSSDRWSLCSDQYMSGRFPKVSIGIMVDKCPMMETVLRKEDAAALHNKAVSSSRQEKVIEESNINALEENRGQKIIETLEGKEAEGKDQKASAWFSSRSIRNETPTTKTTQFYANREAEGKDQKASAWFSSRSIRNETPTTKTTQFYANRASIVQSENGLHKKLDSVAYEEINEKDDYVERVEVVEKVRFATMNESQMPDRGDKKKPENMPECNNEALRMKLWEILSTGPSHGKQNVESSKIEDEKENLNLNHDGRRQRTQPRHYSDTIETDSESPNKTTRRPVTRSLTRKGPPAKFASKLQGVVNYRKEQLSSFSDSKVKLQEKNIFVFNEEGKPGSLEKATSSHSSRSRGKKTEKTVKTEPQWTYSWRPLVPQKGLLHRERVQKLPSTDRAALSKRETGDFPVPSCRGKQEFSARKVQKSRSGLQSSRVPRKLVPEKNLPHNEREQIFPSTDNSPLQSQGTGGSPSTPCPVMKASNQKSILQNIKAAEQKSYTRGLVSEEKQDHNEREKRFQSPDGASAKNMEVSNDTHNSQADACADFGNLPFTYNAETPDTINDPSSKKKNYSWENVTSLSVSKESYMPKMVASPLPEKTDLSADIPSPTFAMNVTPPLPSLGKRPNEVFSSPTLTKLRTAIRESYRSMVFDSPRPGSCGSDANTGSFDATKKYNRPDGSEFLHMEENETGNRSSLSPTEGDDTESFEAGDFMRTGFRQSYKLFSDASSPSESLSKLQRSKISHDGKDAIPCSGLRQAENWSHDDGPKKAPLSLRQTKRVKGLKNTQRTEATTGLHNTTEHYPEDSWESDLVELALLLERFNGNLKSHTCNRSSEILSTTAEKIRLQLQDVETQMQAEIGKFVTTGNAKRKRFESRLQGKQETLRLIYDKFKKEVNQQLQDCKSTLDELEAHRMKLKGGTDKQKASHKKLLLQVEEAMKSELRDAKAMIAAIDKEARKKMYGLKHVLKEWTEDGLMR